MIPMCFVVVMCISTMFSRGCCCPSGWFQYSSTKCMKYFPQNVTFSSAERLCQSLNASLISIHTAEEESAIFRYGVKYIQKHSHWVWLGAKRVNEALKWLDESELDYKNIPNGCKDNLNRSTCLAMHLIPDIEKTLTFWCLFDCERNFNHVVCQRNSDDLYSANTLMKSSIAFKEINDASFAKTFPGENENTNSSWHSTFSQHSIDIYAFIFIALILIATVLHLIFVFKLRIETRRQNKQRERQTNKTRRISQHYCFEDIYDEAKTI